MTINDFLGNAGLKGSFLSFFKDKKLPHAIILEGAAGIGKKTFANIIAQNVVCKTPAPLSCDCCNACKKAIKGIHPDIIFPEKTGALCTYNVATIREVRRDAYILPNEADYKVYIFSDADNMNASAQNALLKVIEEPPKNVVFIFTCESSKNFLDTIKSRSQIFKLELPPEEEAINFLKKKFIASDSAEIQKILKLAGGNIGQAIRLLENGAQKDEYLLAEEILNALVVPNEAELLKLTSKIKNDKESLKATLHFLFNILEESLSCSITNEAFVSDAAKNIAKKLSTKKIMVLIDFINEIINLINKNVNVNLLVNYMTSQLYSIVFSI